MKTMVFAAAVGALLMASQTLAATNLIRNGSFEAGPTGAGPVPEWTRTNTPDNVPRQDQPAAVIGYNNNLGYPTGAYGELVTPDSAVSQSPDAVGSKAAYFVGDHSVNETWSQLMCTAVTNQATGSSAMCR